ncbi:MAG: helix-turn-helix domain-containing protein [Actinopolymorphaceae bacterium]
MADNGNPKRRRLASALRTLREEAGISSRPFADHLGWSQSKVTKTENNRTRLSPEDVRIWAETCGAEPARIRELVALAEDLLVEVQTYPTVYRLSGGVAKRQAEYRRRNEEATRIAIFQPAVIPGLLQTVDYARHIFMLHGVDAADAAAAAAARIERQAVVYDQGKTVEFVIAEHVLTRRVAPASVMLAQLDRLLALLELPHPRIGIEPDDAELAAMPVGPFVLREFEDRKMVTVESNAVEVDVSDPVGIATYRAAFDGHMKTAVQGRQAAAIVRAAMDKLRNE